VAGLVGQERTRLADYSGGTAADLHGLSFCPRLKFGVTAGTKFSKNNDSKRKVPPPGFDSQAGGGDAIGCLLLLEQDWDRIIAAMAFKVFLSYSTDPEEQVIVWRLQTLAAAHGIHFYVPHRQASHKLGLPDEVRNAIDQSDCVLAIITSRTAPAVEKELGYALGKKKPIIPIIEETVDDSGLLPGLPRFKFSRYGPPGQIESQVVTFLKQYSISKEQGQAVGALVAIGLGLFLLSGLTNK
jgi:hypothetical protein